MITAVAHANIALAKYWGKSDTQRNLPAVPSLSLTLDALRTVTRVELDPALDTDSVELDGAPLGGRPLARVVELLDRVRSATGRREHARVRSQNEFPTAAGLASSASGFAALALGALAAYGREPDLAAASALARASSASAARSLYGGFVSLDAGAERAERVAAPDHFGVAMIVALTQKGPKAVGSTEGMQRTMATSPYYAAWTSTAPALYTEARAAVLARDLEQLGNAMEASTLAMHASMFAARPALIYFEPATLAVIRCVQGLRNRGISAYFTMDAGPHVKVLTLPEDSGRVAQELEAVPGVLGTIACRPGPDASVREGSEP